MNKHIEEMAEKIREVEYLSYQAGGVVLRERVGYSHSQVIAQVLYVENGYRKASDVAREVFAQVDGITDLFAVGDIGELEMYDMLGKLKKKYESEGANDES